MLSPSSKKKGSKWTTGALPSFVYRDHRHEVKCFSFKPTPLVQLTLLLDPMGLFTTNTCGKDKWNNSRVTAQCSRRSEQLHCKGNNSISKSGSMPQLNMEIYHSKQHVQKTSAKVLCYCLSPFNQTVSNLKNLSQISSFLA